MHDVGVGEPSEVRNRLHRLFEGHQLSPAQRRIARYLLDHPDEAVFLTGNDLASRVGVSQPSVTRFSVALGFAGYPDLRRELRARLLDQSDAVRPVDNEDDNLVRAVTQEVQALEDVAATLRAEGSRLAELGGLLAGSEPLVVMGLRVSRPLAEMFCYFARKVHPDVRLALGGTIGGDQLEQARHAGATWVLAFGLPRYPTELANHLQWAHNLGLRRMLVTDSPFSPLAHHADEVLTAPVSSELVFDSATAPLSLTMCLLQTLYDAVSPERKAWLEEFDQQAADRRLFLA